MTGLAQTALTTIGTATYGGSNYNLIWDNNNINSIIWLDYTNAETNWEGQKAWAAALNSTITSYNINPAYTVDWGGSE